LTILDFTITTILRRDGLKSLARIDKMNSNKSLNQMCEHISAPDFNTSALQHFNTLRVFFLIAFVTILVPACQNTEDKEYRTWQGYGSGPDQSKYFIQDQITKENVNQLEVVWSYPTGDERDYQCNPVIVDSVMYVLAKDNSLVALNAGTGKEIWIHANLNGISRRGFAYWENADRTDRRILFTLRNSLQAIDAATGKSILTFGKDGAVDLRQDLGIDPEKIGRIASQTPGAIYQDIIVLGSSPGESYLSTPGHVRAYNVVTGTLEWKFNTIPQPGEFGYDTWPADAYKYVGGVNCWGEITIDKKTGLAYIPLGSPTYDYYGADRHGTNLFGNCLIALDAKTGKRIWHYQTVHHDLWDYDLTAAPQLIRVNHNGKKIDAVAIATKQGFMFAFDRANGKPLWPIEERPVPESDMSDEQAWPTQPFPTVLQPFNRQTVTEDDISPIFLSEEEFKQWKERVAKARKGLFTPPSSEETIAMPGAVGGANWGNTASNPEIGLVYVLTQDYPSFYKLEVKPPAIPARFLARFASQQAIVKGKISYEAFCQTCHGKDLSGTGAAPSLLGMGPRLTEAYVHEIVLQGVGRMPPVQHISDEEISTITAYLKDKSIGNTTMQMVEGVKISGPVVAVGGAPGELTTRSTVAFNMAGNEYPEGVSVPVNRYYTGYGLGYPFILNPPWSTITAYDMNTGQIQWSKPLGEEPQAVHKGFTKTGVPTGSQRNGIIVTSNGLLFATVTNGNLYAYDASNGEILWTGQTPLGIASMPSMYALDGRVFIVANATTPQIDGWNLIEEEKEMMAKKSKKGGAYYVYALPKLK
jgi:quinoprotein glucose dehydrogenase